MKSLRASQSSPIEKQEVKKKKNDFRPFSAGEWKLDDSLVFLMLSGHCVYISWLKQAANTPGAFQQRFLVLRVRLFRLDGKLFTSSMHLSMTCVSKSSGTSGKYFPYKISAASLLSSLFLTTLVWLKMHCIAHWSRHQEQKKRREKLAFWTRLKMIASVHCHCQRPIRG